MVILTETWLHPEIEDHELFPSDFHFTTYRKDRTNRKGGGVLIAVRNTLQSSIIRHDNILEMIWVCLHNASGKLVFGVCYRPPDSHVSFPDSLRHELTIMRNEYPKAPIFLFGDFNYPQINWSLLSTLSSTPANEQKLFLELTLDFNLQQVITSPTRGDNILDLLLTSHPDDVKSITVLPGLSDHNLVHISMTLPLKKKSPTSKLIKDYKRADFDAMNNDLEKFFDNFRCTYLNRTPNSNWNLYKDTLLHLESKHVPTLLIKSDTKNQWFNKRLKSLLGKKKRLYRTAKLQNSHLAWEKYRLCAQQYTTELTSAKDKFYSQDLLSILHSNPNKFWRMLSNKPQDRHVQLLDADGEPIKSDDCATALNNYFTSVFSAANVTANEHIPEISLSEMPKIEINPDGVSQLIASLKISTSAGCDQINSKLLKNTISLSSHVLHLIFTQSLDTGVVPDDWKKAQITPIFKADDRTCPNNYRPISLTSIPSKLLEHIIFSNLMTHLESMNFFYPNQHGFRKQLSCETQLAEFTHDILQYLDNLVQIDAIFLDFSKAFDRVSHNLLLFKLSSLGIPQTLLSWLEQFLKGRKQFTCVNNCRSAFSDVTSGVPQGAGLSPLLFLIYINDLPINIKSTLRLFADDCVIYSPIHGASAIAALQQDLTTISAWCDKWHMPLNLNKCQSISFSRKNTVIDSTYNIKSVAVTRTSSYKYLGVHITSSLSWTTHIQTICSKASRTLGFLRRNLKSASPEVKKLAYITFVRPKLEYASSVWHPSQSYLISDLEAIQNRAARFITSQYSRNTSVTLLKRSLGLQTLATRRVISRLCLFHSFFYRSPRHLLLQPPPRTSSRLNHSNPIARIKPAPPQ